MRSFILVPAALAAILAAPPVLADPPPWAPAHGYRAKRHNYTYYPAYEVYYAPETRMWFWLDGGSWRAGVSLPGYLGFVSGGGVSVVLDAERPYERHTYVVERYGRPSGHGHKEKHKEFKEPKEPKHEKDRGGHGKHGRDD